MNTNNSNSEMNNINHNRTTDKKLDHPSILVIGLGKTGVSAVRYLSNLGYKVTAYDDNLSKLNITALHKNLSEVKIHSGKYDVNFLTKFKEIVVSPGVPLDSPIIVAAVKNGINIISDIELFARAIAKKIAGNNITNNVIAITGSNGKGTVTALLGEMIKNAGLTAALGGNFEFGSPALDLLDYYADFYILELSSFQLETTYSLKAKVSVILNLSSDHLDRHHDLQNYLAIKQKIYKNTETAVINRDEPYLYENLNLAMTKIEFGNNAPSFGNFGIENNHLTYGRQKILAINELQIKGQHNVLNALAALAIGHTLHLPLHAMISALQNFPGLPHRCQLIRDLNGVAWYNDSKATNPSATIASILALAVPNNIQKNAPLYDKRIILLAGGVTKNSDFAQLNTTIMRHVKALILFGQNAYTIQQSLIKLGMKSNAITLASSMPEAVMSAQKKAKFNEIVLLSPASASFDMFKNYQDRGMRFTEIVRKL